LKHKINVSLLFLSKNSTALWYFPIVTIFTYNKGKTIRTIVLQSRFEFELELLFQHGEILPT